MNRSNIFVVMLCGLLAVGSVHAAWYSPIVRFGQTLKTQIVRHRFAILATAVLGYFGFDKLRDWKINREKRALVEEQRAAVLTADRPGGYYYGDSAATTSTWGKRWAFSVRGQMRDGHGTLRIIDGMAPLENTVIIR